MKFKFITDLFKPKPEQEEPKPQRTRWTREKVAALHAGLDAAKKIAKEEFREKESQRESYRRPDPNPTFTGPRGGRYRINSKGRKSYDVL